jgi:hypothetical protein
MNTKVVKPGNYSRVNMSLATHHMSCNINTEVVKPGNYSRDNMSLATHHSIYSPLDPQKLPKTV